MRSWWNGRHGHRRDCSIELYGRIPPLAHAAVDGLDPDTLVAAPGPGRQHHRAGWCGTRRGCRTTTSARCMESDQVWQGGDWAARFGLDPDPQNTGYGHTAADVARVRPVDAAALVDYLDAVQARTVDWLRGLDADDLDRIVDRRWDPPVTLGVRLVSVADDSLQHLGQAAYVRGLLDR